MEILQAGAVGIQEENRLTLTNMKGSITVMALVAGIIGVIGIVESIASFSLFQTFMSAGLVWGAVEFNKNAKQSLQDDIN